MWSVRFAMMSPGRESGPEKGEIRATSPWCRCHSRVPATVCPGRALLRAPGRLVLNLPLTVARQPSALSPMTMLPTIPSTAVLVRGPRALPGRLQRVVAGHVEEIGADRVLRAYGAVLALTHVLTAVFWWYEDAGSMLHRGTEPICWALVPGCASLRVFSEMQIELMIAGYGLTAVLIAPLFARERLTRHGYVGLVALTLFKLLILALDFRLRRNQHYMALWVTGVFLLVPGRREALRVLLVLFYVWAGTLKLNWEWLSGAGLYRPLWLIRGREMVMAACAYVIVMELVVAWGLLPARRWIFWGTVAQLALFHIMSWPVVGFFYPVLMFMLLTLVLLDRMHPSECSRPELLEPLRRGTAQAGTYIVLIGFSLFQLLPYTFPGDRAITGEGRIYGLHMFDARVACVAQATVRDRSGAVRVVNLRPGLPPRMDCDPLVIYNRARNLCAGRGMVSLEVADLDLRLASRRSTYSDLREVVNVPNFCTSMPEYRPLRHNEWIAAW